MDDVVENASSAISSSESSTESIKYIDFLGDVALPDLDDSFLRFDFPLDFLRLEEVGVTTLFPLFRFFNLLPAEAGRWGLFIVFDLYLLFSSFSSKLDIAFWRFVDMILYVVSCLTMPGRSGCGLDLEECRFLVDVVVVNGVIEGIEYGEASLDPLFGENDCDFCDPGLSTRSPVSTAASDSD